MLWYIFTKINGVAVSLAARLFVIHFLVCFYTIFSETFTRGKFIITIAIAIGIAKLARLFRWFRH